MLRFTNLIIATRGPIFRRFSRTTVVYHDGGVPGSNRMVRITAIKNIVNVQPADHKHAESDEHIVHQRDYSR